MIEFEDDTIAIKKTNRSEAHVRTQNATMKKQSELNRYMAELRALILNEPEINHAKVASCKAEVANNYTISSRRIAQKLLEHALQEETEIA